MKIKFLLPVLVVLLSPALFAQGVNFFGGTLDEALAKAKAENKRVFLDCYTQWCGPCKMMDANVFPRRDVGEFMNPRFVFLKLDMEHGEGPDLNQKFRVRAYPTYIIMDGDGNEQMRFEGYKTPDAFIGKINAILDSSKSLEALQARYEAGERDKSFLCDYIGALSAEGKYAEAGTKVAELMSLLTEQEQFKSDYWIYWTLYNYARAKPENLDFLIDNQFKFEVGKKEVTDFFVLIGSSSYSAIGFAMPGRPESSAEDLTRADVLARKLGVENNYTIELYRAVACAKLHGDIDGMIGAFEKYGNTVLGAYEHNNFLNLITMSFPSALSEAQRDRLAALAKEEQTQRRILAMRTTSR